MEKNRIKIKSVKELFENNFYIPSYQRGYRWKNEQVKQLIDDIKDFTPTDRQPFYFLQALALARKNDRSYNVVDGQQRLTTIFLILNGRILSDSEEESSLRIFPERGTNSSIDRFYQSQALKMIESQLGEVGSESRRVFCEKIKEYCRFLVYEVPAEKELSTFNDLNSGKIPTKDSELVKCIMLSPGLDEPASTTTARATEWDEMERSLNDERFFAFMTPRGTWKEEDRMTVLFRYAGIIAKRETDEVYPFLKMIQRQVASSSREKVWKEICAVYYRLVAWYKDRLRYHAFGWYVHRRGNKLDKSLVEIMHDLPKVILNASNYQKSDDGNDYNGGINDSLYSYLLLSNVAYCWKRWPMRYDFLRHRHVAQWSLEHIFARNQKDLTEEEFKEWFTADADHKWKEYQNYCTENQGNGNEWLAKELGDKYPAEDEDNSIRNMAMLPKDANSSLNNKLFEGKRGLVIQWAENAWQPYWAPPVTEAVFMKSLPGLTITDPFWSNRDKDAYERYMKEITAEFIEKVNNKIQQKK